MIPCLAFPNNQDRPAGLLERLPMALLARPVGLDFQSPVGRVRFNLAAAVYALLASMPETTMHEHADEATGKYEVWTARQMPRAEPVTEASCVKITPHD